MARNISLEGRVFASESVLKTDPDNDTSTGADLLTVTGGHINEQGPFASHMNFIQGRADGLLNAIETQGILEWSSLTPYSDGAFAKVGSQVYQLATGGDSSVDPSLDDGTNWPPLALGDANQFAITAVGTNDTRALESWAYQVTQNTTGVSDNSSGIAALQNKTEYAEGLTVGGYRPLTQSTASLPDVGNEILKHLTLPYTMLEWFGGGPGQSAEMNTAALNAALSVGKEIKLSRGVYTMDSITVDLAEGQDIAVTGEGWNASLLSFPSGDGVRVNVTATARSMNGNGNTVRFERIGFMTGQVGTGVGLWVNYEDTQAGTASGTSIERTVRDCKFVGVSTDQYWSVCLRITNGSYFEVENVRAQGGSGTLIQLRGTKLSVDNLIRNCRANGLAIGIDSYGQIEGTSVITPTFVSVNRGVYVRTDPSGSSSQKPLVSIMGGHINAKVACIHTDDMNQVLVDNILLYIHQDSTNDARGIWCQKTNSGTTNTGNHQFNNVGIFNIASAKGNRMGIHLQIGNGQSIISNMRINNVTSGIVLDGGSNQCIGGNNLLTNVTTGLVNNGSNNNVSVTVF